MIVLLILGAGVAASVLMQNALGLVIALLICIFRTDELAWRTRGYVDSLVEDLDRQLASGQLTEAGYEAERERIRAEYESSEGGGS